MDPILALDTSAARVVALVGQVDRSQWSHATPCTEWDVRELVGHLVATMHAHVDLLHGSPASALSSLLEQQARVGGDDVGTAAADAATAVRAAFDEPGAHERTVHHLIGDDLAEHVYGYLAPRAEALAATGFYAPPKRTPAAGADVQERLLAVVGR